MITSVYGTCDQYQVVFRQEGGVWRCCIPPDWTDGRYVCELYATADSGMLGYWTGILYISADASICPHLVEDNIIAWLMPDRCASVEDERLEHSLTRRDHHAAYDVAT